MKVVILAGGLGTRLSEETSLVPKPMVEIGGKPIIWHIMKIYSSYGLNEFVILAGSRAIKIKEFFQNLHLHETTVTFDYRTPRVTEVVDINLDWKVTVLETGLNTQTGGRLLRARHLLENEEFFLTYGDGVADVNINKLLAFHKENQFLATVSGVQAPSRFGALDVVENRVAKFSEKPTNTKNFINGGFLVCSPKIFNYLKDDQSVLENEALELLASEGKLGIWKHSGFWQPMDTLREKQILSDYWEKGNAPWKNW